MNHRKIYFNLIEKCVAKNRYKLKKSNPDYVYYENHHIIPKCVGGSNESDNLVLFNILFLQWYHLKVSQWLLNFHQC